MKQKSGFECSSTSFSVSLQKYSEKLTVTKVAVLLLNLRRIDLETIVLYPEPSQVFLLIFFLFTFHEESEKL